MFRLLYFLRVHYDAVMSHSLLSTIMNLHMVKKMKHSETPKDAQQKWLALNDSANQSHWQYEKQACEISFSNINKAANENQTINRSERWQRMQNDCTAIGMLHLSHSTISLHMSSLVVKDDKTIGLLPNTMPLASYVIISDKNLF